jgi:hypothetical protein
MRSCARSRPVAKPFFDAPLQVQLTGEMKEGRPVWITLRPITLTCWLDDERREITAPEGFQTDFASVPRAFWRFAPPGGPYAAAAVIHDWLYIRKIGTRPQADAIFLEGMKAAGVGWFQRSLIYRAVRIGGNGGWGR